MTSRHTTQRQVRLAVALLIGCQAWSPSGRADDRAAVEMARTRFEEGVAFFDAGRYEEARAAFLQAYALEAHPSVLLNLAQSELRGGHDALAARHFTEYLQAPAEKATERGIAERGLAEARGRVCEVHLITDVDSGEVYVDGESVGHLPLRRPLFVAPGPHRIRLRRGSDSNVLQVEAAAGEERTVELHLPPDVEVDLLPTAATAPVLDPLTDASAPPAGPSDSPGDYPSFGNWLLSSPVGTAGLVLTGTGLALGITGTIVASERYASARDATRTIEDAADDQDLGGTICSGGTSDLTQFQNACSERQQRLDQGDTWRALAIGGYVGAVAVAAGTVAYYFLDAPSSAPRDTMAQVPSARIVPIATPRVQGVSIVGTF